MRVPDISVVVPALNEEQGMESFLTRVATYLDSRRVSWEIVVVDDGSTDGTRSLVEHRMLGDTRIRLLTQSHRGKGAAIRNGMAAAQGRWRVMADADLSVAPDDWGALLEVAILGSADVIVASREAPGSRRIGEPMTRHLIGRVFNILVRRLAVPGIDDTQCGFKVFSAAAADALFPHLTIDGFAFDVELLFLSSRAGFRVREVGVVWTCRPESRVRLWRGAEAFVDIVRIRWRHWRGRYAATGWRVAPHAPGVRRAAS